MVDNRSFFTEDNYFSKWTLYFLMEYDIICFQTNMFTNKYVTKEVELISCDFPAGRTGVLGAWINTK